MYEWFSRIKIHYINEQSPNWDNYNGFTISLSYNANGKREKWNDFGVFGVADFNMKLENYAKRYLIIFTDIKNNNKYSAIETIKYNENDGIYCIIFNDNINTIDKNWHEKLYTAFVRYPLFSSVENIGINTKEHEPSNTEKQLIQLYNGMIRLCCSGLNRNYNPFEETLEMKAKKNSRITTQIIEETIHLVQQQQLKTMKTANLQQGGKNKYNLESVKKTSNKKIQNVQIAINQCNVMIKQNMAITINQNENVLENVFLEELEKECERITLVIQEKGNQNKKNIIDFEKINHIEKQAQEMIEYDWKEYNINIIKQWEEKMMEQLQIIIKIINIVNGASNCELSDELKLGKLGEIKIGVFNDEHSFTVRLNQIGGLIGDEFCVQVYRNSGSCLHLDSKLFSGSSSLSSSLNSSSSISDDKSEINEDDTNGKFLSDINNGCGCWFFMIDDGG